MAARCVTIDHDTPLLLPPDLRDWVPENHLVHFVMDAVNLLNLGSAQTNHRGTGSAQYPPSMMLGLLIYCYGSGTFSSRKIEGLTYDSVPVRYLCADTHPDHDSICKFSAGVSSHAYMKRVLIFCAISVLSACSMSKKYGDFYGGKTWYGDKDTIALSSPAINMQSLSRGPKEFLLTCAPISMDPLKFSVGRAGRGGSGKINVEILTYPERRFAGNAIVAEEGKFIRTVVNGNAAARDSWVVRVTEISPIAPETQFKIHYHFKE